LAMAGATVDESATMAVTTLMRPIRLIESIC
jgi:hypothetical protein